MVSSPNLAQIFGSTFVINLPDRVDRRRATEAELRRVGWFNDVAFFEALKFKEPAGFDQASWRGCFHSHLACLKRANERGTDVLILEDDIVLSSSIPHLTADLIQMIGALNWDMIFFGHEESGTIPRAVSHEKSVVFVPCPREILTAHFYAVRQRVLSRLIAHLERNAKTIPHDGRYGPMPADGAYNTFRWFNSDVAAYIAVPKLGWQRPSRSDITPKRIDKIVALRSLLNGVRRVKHLLDTAIHDQ